MFDVISFPADYPFFEAVKKAIINKHLLIKHLTSIHYLSLYQVKEDILLRYVALTSNNDLPNL